MRLHARVKHVRKERANDRRARARRAQPRGAARRESQRLKQRAAVRLRCGGTGEGVGRAAGAGRSERRLFFLEERERVLLHPICVALVMMQGWGTAGGTRRVRLVREEGRGVSSQYGREGGGWGTAACLHRGVLHPPPHRAHRRALRRRPRIAQQPVPGGSEAQLPHNGPDVRAPEDRAKSRGYNCAKSCGRVQRCWSRTCRSAPHARSASGSESGCRRSACAAEGRGVST
jgi:hypothetical protein